MIREINKNDFDSLMKLYTQLHNNPMPKNTSELMELWDKIIQDKNYHIIIAEEGEKIVSSCATKCLNYAKEIAIKENCYKLMLMTGSKQNSTLNFYRKAGYNSKDKTAFIQWI